MEDNVKIFIACGQFEECRIKREGVHSQSVSRQGAQTGGISDGGIRLKHEEPSLSESMEISFDRETCDILIIYGSGTSCTTRRCTLAEPPNMHANAVCAILTVPI